MPEFQPPEGLLPPAELIQTVALRMCSAEKGISHGSVKPCQWCLHDAADALAALEAADFVLLPPGGEVRDQFTVLEIDPEQRNGGMVIHWSLEDAEEWKARFKDDPGGYEGWPYRPGPFGIYRRQARTWGDGSEHYTPWSPVVSDTSDERPQWTIRDHTGTYGVSTTVERVIRRSWAQGITWWDPEGSYELCRREGPDAPWEVVERHPAVPDNSAGQEGLPASTDGVAPPAGDEINK